MEGGYRIKNEKFRPPSSRPLPNCKDYVWNFQLRSLIFGVEIFPISLPNKANEITFNKHFLSGSVTTLNRFLIISSAFKPIWKSQLTRKNEHRRRNFFLHRRKILMYGNGIHPPQFPASID